MTTSPLCSDPHLHSDFEGHSSDHTDHWTPPGKPKPYGCSECGNRFQRHSELQRHGTVHSGEKPYSCSVCGKECRPRFYLQSHLRIHTEEKPHICSVCKKGFTDYSSLSEHLKSHLDQTDSNSRSLSCSKCGKSFQRNSELERPFTRDTSASRVCLVGKVSLKETT